MQSRVLKIVKLSLILLVLSIGVSAQSNNPLLVRADSLFQQKRYIQSLELYQTLFADHRYTPAMLLKMAYIEEGLNNISRSVYYLNLYYLVSNDETALTKLEEVAGKYRLEGYATDETDKVLTFYSRHTMWITGALAAGIIFMITLMATQRFRYKQQPIAAFVVLILFSVALLVHLNQDTFRSKAIISKNNTYIMSGPSAGASVIGIVRDGHRVSVTGKEDIWARVMWGSSEAYVRNTSLLPVTL